MAGGARPCAPMHRARITQPLTPPRVRCAQESTRAPTTVRARRTAARAGRPVSGHGLLGTNSTGATDRLCADGAAASPARAETAVPIWFSSLLTGAQPPRRRRRAATPRFFTPACGPELRCRPHRGAGPRACRPAAPPPTGRPRPRACARGAAAPPSSYREPRAWAAAGRPGVRAACGPRLCRVGRRGAHQCSRAPRPGLPSARATPRGAPHTLCARLNPRALSPPRSDLRCAHLRLVDPAPAGPAQDPRAPARWVVGA